MYINKKGELEISIAIEIISCELVNGPTNEEPEKQSDGFVNCSISFESQEKTESMKSDEKFE